MYIYMYMCIHVAVAMVLSLWSQLVRLQCTVFAYNLTKLVHVTLVLLHISTI